MSYFNPLSLPLNDKQLIEASAGTGKTHSISNLYLRAVLGDGLTKPLAVQQILVVTFTKAACSELKSRIRQRLVYARGQLVKSVVEDEFISDLIAGWSEEQKLKALIHLELAARSVDDAAIYTIHGFCQKVLKDSAFSFGLPFEQTLNEDFGSVQHLILFDWWRSLPSVCNELQRVYIADVGKGPEAHAKRLLKNIRLETNLPGNPKEYDIRPLINEFRSLWPEAMSLFEGYQGGHSGRKPFNNLSVNLNKMSAFLDSYSINIENHDLSWQDFSQSKLIANTKKGNEPLQHKAFELAEMIHEYWIELSLSVELHMARHYQAQLKKYKEESSELDFDRLISLLDESLLQKTCSAKELASQYPLIMVDEFQDTDKAQFRIFSSLADAGSALLMIGDPKQAIYRFRGADIYAYLLARHEANLVGMNTNWRSSSDLVEAVNTIFNQHSFPFIHQEIPFENVEAAGLADITPFKISGKNQKAITLNFGCDGAGWDKDYSLLYTAKEIFELLEQQATVGEKKLSAGEVAVLVRSNGDARTMQYRLRQFGIASILVSDESVFESAMAKPLLYLLRAIIDKDKPTSIFTALASILIDYSVAEILAIRNNPVEIAEIQKRFNEYDRLWKRYGISVAIRRVLYEFTIPQNLLNLPDGQRHLSDLLHLLEILQKKSREIPGIQSLFDWLATKVVREDYSDTADDEKIKLETEHQLVKIVTFHRSKGLQYDVVYIPHLNFGRSPDKHYVSYHKDGEQMFTWHANSEEEEILREEELAEDLRLLYVALTRAKHKIVANIYRQFRSTGIEKTAIGYLLNFTSKKKDDVQLLKALESASVEVLVHDNLEDIRVPKQNFENGDAEKYAELTVESYPEISNSLQVASFSSITGSLHHGYFSTIDELFQSDEVDYSSETQDIRFDFTKGAEPGNFLHSVFEIYLRQKFADRNLFEIVKKQWSKFHLYDEFEKLGIKVTDWLQNVLDTELAPELVLQNLKENQSLPEMEFYLSISDSIADKKLNSILKKFGYETQPSLCFEQLQGYLKGFIDLIFEHQGKFYVLDYKSNYLGPSFNFYQKDDLKEAIKQHHYQLQYVLYTLALHRYLKSRVGDYNYDQHIGGVYYLFLRGVCQGQQTGIFYDHVPKALIEELDDLFDSSNMGVGS